MSEYCRGTVVQRIMRAGQGGIPLRKAVAILKQGHLPGSCIVVHLIVRVGMISEGFNRTRQAGCDVSAMSAVMGDEQPAAFRFRGNLSCETGERLDDRIQRTVHIEVVFFDVVDQRDSGAMVVKRTIELTGFTDQDARPACHRAIAGDMCRAGPTPPPSCGQVAPMMNPGSNPASTSMWQSMAEVVLLPCVPARQTEV